MIALGIGAAAMAALGYAVSRCPLVRAIRAHVGLVAATR